jgi:signal transduction histidine kinase
MALLFTVLCGGALMILGYFGYYFTKGHFIDGTEAVIDTEIRYLSTMKNIDALPVAEKRLYVFFEKDGKRPSRIPKDVRLLSEGIIVFDNPENGRKYAAKIHTFPDGRRLLVGVDITEANENYTFMLRLSLVSIIFMTIVIAVSFLISVFVARGTNKIAVTAREIMDTGDLSRRLDVGSRWDDLGNMAAVLNSFLDRIQQLMQDMRQVSDNIAHDLRTPLTRLRNRIEGLRRQSPDNADYEELLIEADHILSIFNALLRISRIESEKQKGQFQSLNLATLLADVAAFYEPLAEEKNIRLSLQVEPSPFHGDRDLLFQAFANILDNALKFTPSGGAVSIRHYRKEGRHAVEISDTGPGVLEAETGKIFTRFYRGEKSRNSPGAGLGLSLVAAIIGLHNGEIKAENNANGFQIITIL